MQTFLNKYGVYVVTVILVLAGIIWFFFGRGPKGLPSQAYFIDEDTGEESVQAAALVPPLQGAKGNASVVKVYKFRVGDGPVKVGYYFKFTPEMKHSVEEMQKHPEGNDLTPATGMLIRLPAAGSPWVPALSSDGAKIINVAPGNTIDTVYP